MFRVWTEGAMNGKEIIRRIETWEGGGVEYQDIPEQPTAGGRKQPILLRDPATGVLSWEEVDRQPNENERIQDLEASLAQKEVENANLRADCEKIKQDSSDTTLTILDLYEMINPPA